MSIKGRKGRREYQRDFKLAQTIVTSTPDVSVGKVAKWIDSGWGFSGGSHERQIEQEHRGTSKRVLELIIRES